VGGQSSGTVNHVNVGVICSSVVMGQVDLAPVLYKSRQGDDGQWHPFRSYFHADGTFHVDNLNQWWQQRRGKTLSEMRQEIVDWYISREKEIGFATPDDEEDYLKPLLDLKAKLTALGDKPRLPGMSLVSGPRDKRIGPSCPLKPMRVPGNAGD
jgi:hypothetical protein